MKASQMRDMSRDDLILEEAALREQLFKLRFQVATGQLESAGRMLFEMEGVSEETAREAFRLAAHKLSIPTQFRERVGAVGAAHAG